MKYFFAVIKSKYFIATIAFGAWIFFFDKNDVPSQISRRKELTALNAKVSYYKEQIKLAEEELENLQNNSATLEKYAREKYFMKKDNEEVFIIE